MCNQKLFIICYVCFIFYFSCIDTYMNAFWFAFSQIKCIDDNLFLFVIIRRTAILFALVHFDSFLFALSRRTDMKISNLLRTHIKMIHLLRVGHLCSYKSHVRIEYHHTLSKMYWYIKVTVSRYMFLPLCHITLIRQLPRLLNNLRNILQTEISAGISWLFVFLWPFNGLETQRGNQPLSWSSLKILCFWWCDFYLVHNTKIQRDFQGDVLLTILDISVFPNIATTTIFHVHQCELFLPERLLSWGTMINRRWC